MKSVLTLIAADRLDDSTLSRIREILPGAAAPDWLAPGKAADIAFSGLDQAEAEKRARAALNGAPVDLVAQPAEGRRKKLLVADMDSTMVIGETLDELAAFAGLKDQIAAITKRAMNGEIDFKAALRERVGLLAGLADTALAETYKHLDLMPGANTLVGTMRANGAHTVLASGGFDYFTGRVRERCGFHDDRANQLEIEGGKLTGKVIEPILDRDSKLFYLRDFAAKLGLDLQETLAVGDGANDLDMIRAAGLGVAYHAKPVVAGEAKLRVDHNDLTALLYAQGYHKVEFVG
ncbi:MAG TPA: phosphoserine phosphatase SerB [Magnetospirillaceae bacterium]|nr:phosphoserine phosphatase SerB [Magnetospirillaceae bacterium]